MYSEKLFLKDILKKLIQYILETSFENRILKKLIIECILCVSEVLF